MHATSTLDSVQCAILEERETGGGTGTMPMAAASAVVMTQPINASVYNNAAPSIKQ